jgi:hypothetical protein
MSLLLASIKMFPVIVRLEFKCDLYSVLQVLEGKPQYVEFAGNLVPVTKSGDQLQLGFRAFKENRLPFTVRVKDPHADTVGRILFMREPKVSSLSKIYRYHKKFVLCHDVCVLNTYFL